MAAPERLKFDYQVNVPAVKGKVTHSVVALALLTC
jgi:hypothetical protein